MERSELVRRVSRLEGGVRRDRLVVFGALVLVFFTAQAPAGPVVAVPVVVRDAAGGSATLTSKGLTVRDATGKIQVVAGIDVDGRPGVDLGDSSGQLRESMYLLNELPVLRQFDAAGKRRAEIRLDSSNDGELLINDANEKLRLALFRTSSGDPEFGLYGTDEKLRGYFASDNDSPYLVMRDSSGTTRVYAGGYKDGSIGMDVRNSANTVLWKAP